jgi:hypothetical protein
LYDEGEQFLERLKVHGSVRHQMLYPAFEGALLHLSLRMELHDERPPGG